MSRGQIFRQSSTLMRLTERLHWDVEDVVADRPPKGTRELSLQDRSTRLQSLALPVVALHVLPKLSRTRHSLVRCGARAPAAARAVSGHAAAAPPSAVSNSCRPMVTVIRPSRARCVKGTIPRHERAVFRGQDAGCFHPNAHI